MPDTTTPATNETFDADILSLTADIASAYLSQNHAAISDIPNLIQTISTALIGVTTTGISAAATQEETYAPAVPVRSSIKHDHLISLIDGKPYKTLRRHLGKHGLTPQEYIARFGLKADYPMVAPAYSAKRSEMAKALGLGRKRVDAAPAKPKRVRKAAEATA